MKNQEINGLKYQLSDVKNICKKWLHLEDDRVIDVMLAIYLANQFQTDPLWMVFIAPPSNTKTELLRAFKGHPGTCFLSNLTPSTLISGMPKKKNFNPSLIFELDNKVLILKDFTTILSMRSENQQEVISQLREIYDGQYKKAFGTGQVVDWEGHVGLMAACTPIYDKHYGVIGSLGDRFLLYRTENPDGEAMGCQAQRIVGREEEMREEIRNSFHAFINQFNGFAENLSFQTDPKVKDMIVTLACFCAVGRTPVERDFRTRTIDYDPQPEGPARLVKQFMQLGMSLALIHGKKQIDVPIYELLKKVGHDLVSSSRLKLLRFLWDEQAHSYSGKWVKTKEIANATMIPVRTVKLFLEDMMVIRLLNRYVEDEGETSPYNWQLTENAYDLISGAEVFTITDEEPF